MTTEELTQLIRTTLNGKITPEGMTEVGNIREGLPDPDLPNFDDALDKVLNEIRNPPSQPPVSAAERALAAAIRAQRVAEEARHTANEALRLVNRERIPEELKKKIKPGEKLPKKTSDAQDSTPE